MHRIGVSSNLMIMESLTSKLDLRTGPPKQMSPTRSQVDRRRWMQKQMIAANREKSHKQTWIRVDRRWSTNKQSPQIEEKSQVDAQTNDRRKQKRKSSSERAQREIPVEE